MTSYGPFHGLKGKVLKVDRITADIDEPFCFYLVALEGAYIQEPIWFEFREVDAPSIPYEAQRSSMW